MTIRRFLFIEDTYSILLVILHLLNDGEYGLFLALLVFSVLFPAIKLLLTFRLWLRGSQGLHRDDRMLRLLAHLGKWSMVDVLVVAFTIVVLKTGAIMDVTVHAGIFLFGLSVLLLGLATLRIQSSTGSLAEEEDRS